MDNNSHGVFKNIFVRKNKNVSLTHRVRESKIKNIHIQFNLENSDSTIHEKKIMNNNNSESNYFFKLNSSKTPLKKYLSGRIGKAFKEKKYSINYSTIPQKLNLDSINGNISSSKNFETIIKEKKDNEEEEINPFTIPKEDLIFNHPLLKPGSIQKNLRKFILNQKTNEKEKNNKKKEKMNKTYQSSSYKILKEVYNKTLTLDNRVRPIKRNKKKFNLNNYQRLLINTAGDSLSTESISRLRTAFNCLKHKCYQNLGNDYKFIRDIEEEEKKIVDSINNSRQSYIDLLKNSRSFTKTFRHKFKIDLELPKINFRRINVLKKMIKIKMEK